MSIKTPRLIRDRCGVFYFRLIVPKEHRSAVGKMELRRSLRTKDPVIARWRALSLSLSVEEVMSRSDIDLEKLLGTGAIRKSMTIDFERGIFTSDRPEEMVQASRAASLYAEVLKARASVPPAQSMPPAAKAGTLLRAAADAYLLERGATLKPSTLAKHKGTLTALVSALGNVGVGVGVGVGLDPFPRTHLTS